jgi:SNF family Na+-dependent transporter
MFQMRKPGFWVYLLGTGVSVMAPLVVFGADNIVGIVMGSGTGLIGIVFCVLYAVNLKHMR